MSTDPSKVLPPRTATPARRERDPQLAEAGTRFESYVRDAMVEVGLPSLAELARQSGIAASAWHGWFRGDRRPRKNSLTLAGRHLNRTPDQLLAVWDGDRPRRRSGATETPDELVSALGRQTAAIERLVALLEGDLPARVAALEAVVGRLAERVLEGSPGLPLPRETGG